jgi:D-aminoacyl-tRNA deacylase
MRALIQRVTQASLSIQQVEHCRISSGVVVLIGIEPNDTQEDIIWLSNKITNLRILNDAAGVMNISIKDADASLLLVSQFTLFASTVKGNRPSYIRAAKPDIAIPLYHKLISQLELMLEKPIATGVFGADMQVNLTNDGPVTIWLDSKNRE